MKKAGIRPGWPRWSVALTVVAVVSAGGAAAIAKWPHPWWWLAVAVAAAAALPPALAASLPIWQGWRDIRHVTQAGFQGPVGRRGGGLPTVKDADLEQRASQTILTVPYIQRDVEVHVRDHLKSGRPVLLIGPSMVGKTKMAARLISEEFRSWPIAIPGELMAFSKLISAGVKLRKSVVWLDDIERLLDLEGITDKALRQLSGAGNVLVATIRTKAYSQFMPSDFRKPPQWDVLAVFSHFYLDRSLTAEEQARLSREVSDPEIRDRILTVGLGEYVGAASQVVEVLRLGAGTKSPGYALVLAAADWRRGGMTRPVPSSVLMTLAKPYLDQKDHALLSDRDSFEAAFDWATKEINPNVALLRRTSPDSFVLYDYVLDLISAEGQPIPVDNWEVLLDSALDNELINLGRAADTYFHEFEVAVEAYWRAAETNDPSIKAAGAFNLRLLMRQQENYQIADEVWTRLGDSSPEAALKLGELFESQDYVEDAKLAYQQAIDSGHPDIMPEATVRLGELLRQQGEIRTAEETWRQAGEASPETALKLGKLFASQRYIGDAKLAYQQAIDSGHPDIKPEAAVRLGELLEMNSDAEAAKVTYRQAVDSGHPDCAPRAAVKLGKLVTVWNDDEEAEALYRLAFDSGHPDASAEAAVLLGKIFEKRWEMEAAKAAYQHAIDSPSPYAAEDAQVSLKFLLKRLSDIKSTKSVLKHAIDSGDADEEAWDAANKLETLLWDNVDEIKEVLGEVIESGYANAAPRAAFKLGWHLGNSDCEGAKAAYQRAIEFGHPTLSPMAAINLGGLLQAYGDVRGAEAVWRPLVSSKDADIAARASVNIGHLLEQEGDIEGAKSAYQQAIDAGDVRAEPNAATRLGDLTRKRQRDN